MPTDLPSQQQCPLCGENNFCAVSQNAEAKQCWCMDVAIPPELIEQANQRPGQKRCICQACAERSQELAREL